MQSGMLHDFCILYFLQRQRARNTEPTARFQQFEQKPLLHREGGTTMSTQHVIQQFFPTVARLV
jgi:hypothetical protein